MLEIRSFSKVSTCVQTFLKVAKSVVKNTFVYTMQAYTLKCELSFCVIRSHFLQDQLGPHYDAIGDDALKLFEALERENLIHDEDTQLLRVLFEGLDRLDLLDGLTEYEQQRTAVMRKLNKNASLLEGMLRAKKKPFDFFLFYFKHALNRYNGYRRYSFM